LSRGHPEVTPYECIFKKKPYMGHLKVWGTKAYLHIPHQRRTVWKPKVKMVRVVGYDSSNSKLYRVYPDTHDVTDDEPTTDPDTDDDDDDCQ